MGEKPHFQKKEPQISRKRETTQNNHKYLKENTKKHNIQIQKNNQKKQADELQFRERTERKQHTSAHSQRASQSCVMNDPSEGILKKAIIRRRETIYAATFGGYSSLSFSSA